MATWTLPVGDELVTFDSDTMTATTQDGTRAMTPGEEQMVAATLAAQTTEAALRVTLANAQALRASAGTLLNDFIAHAQTPVANRDPVAAASLDSRAGALMAQALPSSDPTIIGLTAKTTAIGLRLTRERDDYEAGLL